MEGGDSIFDSIFDEENLEGVKDVEMLDAEEGELVEQSLKTEVRQSSGVDVNLTSQESKDKSRRQRNKKKNKRKKGNSGSNITDVNRFVVDVCRHLKERKSYLVWTAVGCLGMFAFSDLVKEISLAEVISLLPVLESRYLLAEPLHYYFLVQIDQMVEAIQACGGQKTADGRRYRTGGGILWGILKVRDPNAYKEIMKKGNEFEKQFKQHNVMQPWTQNKSISQGISLASTDQSADSNASSSQLIADVQNQPEQQSFIEQKRSSVHDRIRVPVAYDDLLGVEDSKDESS